MEVLTLKKLGIDDLVHFDFLDPPAPETMMSLGFVRRSPQDPGPTSTFDEEFGHIHHKKMYMCCQTFTIKHI